MQPPSSHNEHLLTAAEIASLYSYQLSLSSWASLVAQHRGISNITAGVHRLPHKAARLLEHLRRRGAGVPLSTAPWTIDRCSQALRQGPHQSAQAEREFVSQEMLEFCQQGYLIVDPHQAIAHCTSLQLSPLGVVPQRNRRSRLIADYSFSGINADTIRLGPNEAMQFGRALQRVMSRIVYADPRYGPVHLAKIDIADGFYRVWLRDHDIPKLAVLLPCTPSQPQLIALPLTLPMGWVESPPSFTALTETACDVANQQLRRADTPRLHHHHLEALASTCTDPLPLPPLSWIRDQPAELARPRSPLATVDVYVDDFLLLAQTQHQHTRTMRITLHAIDSVFRPLVPSDTSYRKEPTSVKKLLQGDAAWSPTKRILGWDINTITHTLHLPQHRLARLYALLDTIRPPRKRISLRLWHQLLGELRSMSPALAGSRGLFSALHEAFYRGDKHRIRLNAHVFAAIADFPALADSLHLRPTCLRELVPSPATDLGACDACRLGKGACGSILSTTPHRPSCGAIPFSPPSGPALVSLRSIPRAPLPSLIWN